MFAVREPSETPELDGLPSQVVAGLPDADARRLLAEVAPGRWDERVVDRMIAEAQGNPLALLELPLESTPAALAGGFGLPPTRSVTTRVERSFVRRVEALPPEAAELLLIAAAEPVGDVVVLWRTAERLGVSPESAAPAEAAGLIELGTRVRFRHPLVRSAVYRAASPGQRRRVHGALADATDAEADPDRRAWHRAYATIGLDEAAAAELERSAVRASAAVVRQPRPPSCSEPPR